jgi:hypothetical protein
MPAARTASVQSFLATGSRRPTAWQHEDFHAVGQNWAGIDTDDTHTEVRARSADRASERHQPGIAHRAGDICWVEFLAAHADDVDDHSPAPRFHFL